jgi:hypothetical protein
MLVILCLLPMAIAQFGNFFQGGFPFGGGGGEQQQQQQRPRREHKGWTEMESGELDQLRAASHDSFSDIALWGWFPRLR